MVVEGFSHGNENSIVVIMSSASGHERIASVLWYTYFNFR